MASPGYQQCTAPNGHSWTVKHEHGDFSGYRISECTNCGLQHQARWKHDHALPDRYAAPPGGLREVGF